MLFFITFAFFVAVCSYSLFYNFRKVSKPRVFGHGALLTYLLEKCPHLQQIYWPTWWAFTGNLMTLVRVLMQQAPHVKYKREIFITPDNGELALDWYDTNSCVDSQLKGDEPILLILPGLESNAEESYIKWLVHDGINQNYWPVVMNYRGRGGVLLKTFKTYCFNPDDIGPVVDHILNCLDVPIVAVGVSFGGIILVQHLVKTQEQCGLLAAMTYSSPWNLRNLLSCFEKSLLNNLIYNQNFTTDVIKYMETNCEHLIASGKVDICVCKNIVEQVRNCSTVRELDAILAVPVFGYNSLKEYYDEAKLNGKIHLVKVPLLSVSAINDPIVSRESLPVTEFQANSNTVFVVLQDGGHVGFIKGLLPVRHTWIDELVQEYLAAIKLYQK